MTLNVNGTEMSLVYADGTRMSVVNVNGTEVYRAENGNVTMIYTGTGGSFSPGVEDINRHFVAACTRFSGSGLGFPGAPSINGVTMNTITSGVDNKLGDGGITGIYTLKIPTGTSSLSISIASFTYVALYRVTGITSMTSAISAGTSGGAISGSVSSSSNGCFFGASVTNFGKPSFPSPSIGSLQYNTDNDTQGRMGATNATSGPTQSINLDGNQINSYAIFGYDLY